MGITPRCLAPHGRGKQKTAPQGGYRGALRQAQESMLKFARSYAPGDAEQQQSQFLPCLVSPSRQICDLYSSTPSDVSQVIARTGRIQWLRLTQSIELMY